MKSDPISKVMISGPYSVQASHHISVALKLMTDKRIRHLPVLDGKKIRGVVALRDVQASMGRPDAQQATVAMAELAEPVTFAPTTTILDAVKAMVASRADIAIVVDKERVVGVFTTIDALHLLARVLEEMPG